MPLTTIQAVRSHIGDMDKIILNETVGIGGQAIGGIFQLDMSPARTGTVSVFVSGVAKISATANFSLGFVDFTGCATGVTAGAQIKANYQYNALSDDEIQAAIDEASGAILLAASLAARSLAGNYARFFSYTQGSKSIDKDKLSDKLLRLAESLARAQKDVTTLGPAGATMKVVRFDDSGTEFDGFDTAVANVNTGSVGWL